MSEDLYTVSDGAVTTINNFLLAHSTAIFLFSKQGLLRRTAAAGFAPEDPEEYQPSDSLVGQAVQAEPGNKYAVQRLFTFPDLIWSPDGPGSYDAILVPGTEILTFPLNGPNRTYGIIRCIGKHRSDGTFFAPADLAELPAFCHQVAISISNIRRQLELEVHDRISTLATSTFTINETFATTARMLVEDWTDFASCAIRTIDKRGDLVLVGFAGSPGIELDTKQTLARDPTHGFPGRVLHTGEPQVVRNVQSHLDEFSDKRWIRKHKFQTVMFFPIIADDNKIGTLTLFLLFDLDLTKTKRRFIVAVCKQLATATTISRLVRARDHLIERLRDLVSPDQTVDGLLSTILDGAKELTGGSEGYIALTTKNDKVLHPRTHTSGLTKDHIPEISIDGPGLTALAATTRELVNCGNVRAGDDVSRAFVDLRGNWSGRIQSEMTVPMLFAGRVLGVIAIESERRECFTRDDEAVLRTLAGIATLVFQRHQFYEAATKLANLDFPRHDRAAVHANLAAEAAELIGAEAAVLAILERGPRRLRVVESWPSSLLALPTDLPAGVGLCWAALESRKPEWFSDLSRESGFHDYDFAARNGFRGMLAIPLFITQRTSEATNEIGVLNVFFSADAPPLPTEIQLMRAFASSASHALRDAQFLDATESRLTFATSIARFRAIADIAGTLRAIRGGLSELVNGFSILETAATGVTADNEPILRRLQTIAVAARAELDELTVRDGVASQLNIESSSDDDSSASSILNLITKQSFENISGPTLNVSIRELWDTVGARLGRIVAGLPLVSAACYSSRGFDYASLGRVAATASSHRFPDSLALPTFDEFRQIQGASPVRLPAERGVLQWLDGDSLLGSPEAYVYAREFIGGNLVVVAFGVEAKARLSFAHRAILHEMVSEQLFAYIERAMFRIELDELTSETGHLMGEAVGKVGSGVRILLDILGAQRDPPSGELYASALEDIEHGALRLKLIRQNFYSFRRDPRRDDGRKQQAATGVEIVNIVQLLQQMRRIFDATAADAELEPITYDFRVSRALVRGWPVSLQLTFLNLVDNACKFAYKNTFVAIRVTATTHECVVAIDNIGVGVAPDEQTLVFQRLQRSRFRDPHRHIEGLGLGLSYCRRIVEQDCGGSITLASRAVETRSRPRFEGDNWLTTVTVVLPTVQPTHARRRRR